MTGQSRQPFVMQHLFAAAVRGSQCKAWDNRRRDDVDTDEERSMKLNSRKIETLIHQLLIEIGEDPSGRAC